MIPRIDADALDELTREWSFAIRDDERAEYLDLAEFVLSVLDTVEDRPRAPVENVEAERDPGRPPEPGEDPLNALVRICRVRARTSGPLEDVRVALKDSVAVAGLPLTCGSRVLEGHVPAEDAVVTRRILEAGGEIVAVTNMDSLAFSGGGDTSDYGPTLCPFDLTRTAGGSSSGSAAALWYEGVDAGIGTDQGGSIRVPAAWSGVLGLKPTHGLVPYTGIAGIDQTFDHAGPFARDVEMLARLLQAIAGPDPSDPRQCGISAGDYVGAVRDAPHDLAAVRIGVVEEAFGEDPASAPVRGAVERVVDELAGLGAPVRAVSLPEHVQGGGVAFAGFVEGMTALMAGGGNGFHWAGRYAPDLALAWRRGLDERGDALPPQVKLVLAVGTHLRRRYAGALYAQAQNLRPWLRDAYDRALAEVDLLLLPTTPGLPHAVAPELSLSDRVKRGWAVLANTYPTDMTGHPAISLPLADAGGLPVGVMLVARRFADAQLVSVARTLERAVGWRPLPPATLAG